jgi:hypothetical protein
MPFEYTVLVIIGVIGILVLDKLILKTKLLFRPVFWCFSAVIIILQTIVDNYLNGRWWYNEPIVGPYGDKFYSTIKIWHTPIENYIYGLTLIWLNIIIFEYLTRKQKSIK